MRIIARIALGLVVAAGCIRVAPSSGVIYRIEMTWVVIPNMVFQLPNIPWIPDINHIAGTGVAVDADGMLLTARHVVDIGMNEEVGAPKICDMQNVNRVEVALKVTDALERHWLGEASAVVSGEALCDDLGRVRFQWDPMSTAHVVALGGVVDIALVHIKQEGIEHITLNPAVRPKFAEPVRLEGRPLGWSSLKTQGKVIRDCIHEKYVKKWLLIDEPVVMMDAPAYPGMSGGLVLDGDTFLGILVMRGDPVGSLAVSSSYAAQWYAWVRGRTPYQPSIECP